MRPRRRALGAALAGVVSLLAVTHSESALADELAPEAEPPTYVRDDAGRRMRVRFDPGNRWHVGAGLMGGLTRSPAGEGEDGPREVAVELSTQFAGRNAVDLGREGIRYKLYHRVLDGRLDVPTDGSGYALDATLYDARFMRWAKDGSVLIPTSPPVRMPFPFGIGFRGQLGHLELEEDVEGLELGVTQVELRLDLWRRRDLRSYAELGAASSYRIDVWTDEDDAYANHLVAPFTLGTLILHHESSDGHHAVDAALEAGLLLSTSGDEGLTARAELGYEGLLLALNDWPVSAFAEASARADELDRPVSPSREVRFQSGLRLSAPLD